LEHALSHCIADIGHSPHDDGSQMGLSTPVMHDGLDRQLASRPSTASLQTGRVAEMAHAVPSDPVQDSTPNAYREITLDGPLWLCLGFAPRLLENPDLPASGTGISSAVLTDIRKTVQLPHGDDAFLQTLPEFLERSVAR